MKIQSKANIKHLYCKKTQRLLPSTKMSLHHKNKSTRKGSINPIFFLYELA